MENILFAKNLVISLLSISLYKKYPYEKLLRRLGLQFQQQPLMFGNQAMVYLD